MIDHMEISEQLQCFCEAFTLAKRMLGLMTHLGPRLVAAEEADVLSNDQLSQWEEAFMEYYGLLRKLALALQEE